MNILITLPKPLIDYIVSGEKKFEMRKSVPTMMELGVDGFFVVEKGTSDVRCWCRVDDIYTMKFARNKIVYLWKIGKVVVFSGLERNSLCVIRNPPQFVYCPFSYGQSY